MSGDSRERGNVLLDLIDLGHRARAAAGSEELAFLLVNDTRRLTVYRQAALWFAAGGVTALSGVLAPEANAPYGQWLQRLCRHLHAEAQDGAARSLTAADLPPELAAEWQEWLPAHALWLPLPAAGKAAEEFAGGLLLAGEDPGQAAALPLLTEWLHIWSHAWRALHRPSLWSPRQWRQRFAAWRAAHRQGRWWRRRPNQILLGALLLCFLPVRLTALAPGELVPAAPAMLRAPLDGVIERFHVRPNEAVQAGQLLFSFDEAPIASRLEVARQALATAEAEYRQSAQMALADTRSKGQLAVLLGRIGERRAEAEFLAGQFERSRAVAPQDGIALFDDPSEWIGRPVQTGERIMRIARPHEVEIEAWVPIGDAIPLAADAPVSLYLAASPFAAVSGRLSWLSHEAMPRPDGSQAYRARARLDGATGQRIGLKGTARLHGGWVPLAYWVLRRPLASIRQFLAI